MNIKIVAALLAFASPAIAQDRMTDEQCAASVTVVEQMMGMPDTGLQFQADTQGWCQTKDASFDMSDQQQIRISSLRWRATDIARLIDEGLPPRALEIVGEGFGMSIKTSDPVFDYLFGLQSSVAQSGFGLSVRWDGVQNIVSVDDAYFDFFPQNRIEATALIDGINLTDVSTIETSLGTVGLRELNINSELNGWFEAYVAMSVGPMLLDSDGGDPEAQVAALQQQAIGIVAQLPDEIVSKTSRDALDAFILDLPSPRGTAQLQLTANPSLGALRLAPFALMQQEPSLDQIIDLGLNDVAVTFTWAPTGDDK